MSPTSRQKLRSLLIQHESYRQYAYTDETGHITIGIGRNLNDRGISLNEALYLLDDDILYFTTKLSSALPCWSKLNDARQIALVDMCFNVGVQGLLNFKEMIEYLNNGEYQKASDEMMNSRWKDEVKERANCVAEIIRTGEI